MIAGNPAKIVKTIPRNEFVPMNYKYAMYGYIPANKFKKWKERHLSHIKFEYDLRKVCENKELTDFFYETSN